MSLSTVANKLAWTPEEDEVILRVWNDNLGMSGRAKDGFIAKLQALLPHRSIHAIRNHKSQLVTSGKIPPRKQRSRYRPLQLSQAEAAWLCGVFEGEGSIADFYWSKNERRKPYRQIRLVICYNSDLGMIRKAAALLPSSWTNVSVVVKHGVDTRGVRTNRDVHKVSVTTHEAIVDVLHHLLPHMAHEDKRLKCLRVLEYLEARLAA